MRFTTSTTNSIFSIPSGSGSDAHSRSPSTRSSSAANGGQSRSAQPAQSQAQRSNSLASTQVGNSRPVPKRRFAGEYDLHLVSSLGHIPASPISRAHKPPLNASAQASSSANYTSGPKAEVGNRSVGHAHEEATPPTSPGKLVLTFGGKPVTESRTRSKSPSSRASSPGSGRCRSGSALADFITNALPNFAKEEWVGTPMRLRK